MSPHLSQQNIEQYRQRTLPPLDLIAADDHLAICEACRRQLDDPRILPTLATKLRHDLKPAISAAHLSDARIAAYVDGELNEAARQPVEEHLAKCPKCANEAAELRTFAAELSAYPDKEYAPAGRRGLMDRLGLASLWRSFQPPFSFALSPVTAGALALVVLLAIAAAIVWRNQRSGDRDWLANDPTVTPTPDASPPRGSMPQPDPSEPPAQVLLALNDGEARLTLDAEGNLAGAESFSAADQQRIKAALTTKRAGLPASLAELGDPQGTLMGGPSNRTFSLVSPLAKVITTDRPALRWEKLEGAESYRVEINDPTANYKEVAASPRLTAAEWKVDRPLRRGRVYSWQVVALKDGRELRSPAPDTPEAKFKVLESSKLNEIERAKRANAGSHLLPGLLYAQAGLIDEAEAEFKALVAANPQSAEAKILLRDVQSKRRAK